MMALRFKGLVTTTLVCLAVGSISQSVPGIDGYVIGAGAGKLVAGGAIAEPCSSITARERKIKGGQFPDRLAGLTNRKVRGSNHRQTGQCRQNPLRRLQTGWQWLHCLWLEVEKQSAITGAPPELPLPVPM